MTTQTEPRPSPAPAVAAVVVAEDAALLEDCLDAVERQVYAPAQVFVVGGDDEVRGVTGRHEATWRPVLRTVTDGLDPAVTFIWVLADGARPRVDALSALVRDGARVDASVGGSKILDAEDPDVLVAVGYATDVFDAPYSGLQEGERDQAQYDVVRDVAAVSGMSMLIRRDLFFGLRGIDPLMAPTAAAIDFCQRARLRGGRVVAIPSSEVPMVVPEVRSDWRERAGEIRAMLKVYSPVTLLWAVPLVFLAGLVESVAGLFLGRWRLFGFAAAWAWNVLHFPSAVRARFEVRRGRQVGDEELFRYQVGGSARLRGLYDETLERVRARFPEGVLSGFGDVMEAGQQQLRRPSFVAAAVGVVFAFVATRAVWQGRLPTSGFALPPTESALDVLGSYAGGWNPAGLGSPEVLHPAVAATAVVQLILFGKGGLAVGFLTVAAFLMGVFGTARLLRGWGIGAVPGYLAGMVLMAGPGVVSLSGAGRWLPLVSLGVIPWALAWSLRPWPAEFLRGAARVAGIAVACGVAAAFAPVTLVVPVAAVLLWGLVGVGPRWGAALRIAVGSLLALPLLAPWILYADLRAFASAGSDAFWEPAAIAVAAVGVGAIGAVLAGDRGIAAVAGWGALVAAGGALVARSGDFGAGREVEAAGLVAVSLGVAAVAGASLELYGRRDRLRGPMSFVGMIAVGAGVGLVLATVLLVGPGRAGLPQDRFREVFTFAAPGDAPPSRVLAFGSAGSLPGESRDLEGLRYRVITPPIPRSWDTYLNEPRLGDDELHRFLDRMLDGEERRAGETLARFGIGWVAFMESSPLETLFEAQLDMVALRSLDVPVFRNEIPAPRASAADGTVWEPAGTGYRAPGGASPADVRVAENADDRWGPGDWRQDGWANVVAAEADRVDFGGYRPRTMLAAGAAGWLALLVVAAAAAGRVGRKR
jgi:hypothetical protein